MFDKNMVLISVACIFKKGRGAIKWLVAQPEEDSDWELPRIAVRKGESSARAAIRMAGEQLGIGAQVLEEAGRAGGIVTINNKTVSQRTLYYLMIHRASTEEALAFHKIEWLDYAKAIRRLPTKRDRQMLKQARAEFASWEKSGGDKEEGV